MDVDGSDVEFLSCLNLMATNQDEMCQEISVRTENDSVFDGTSLGLCLVSRDANCIVTANPSLPIDSIISRIEEEQSESDADPNESVDLLEQVANENGEEGDVVENLFCIVCKSKYSRMDNLIAHLSSKKHFDNISESNMAAAASLYSKYHHLLLRHSTFRCACCSFSPVDHQGLITHLKSQQHRESISALTGPVECSTCHFLDYDGHSLLEHCQSEDHLKLAIHGCCVKEKRYNIKCPTCGQVLHSTAHYASHQRQQHPTTSGSDMRECRYCDYAGKSSAVSQHIVRFHCNERRYNCTACEIGFNFAYDLRKHKNTVKHVNSVLDTYKDKIRAETQLPTHDFNGSSGQLSSSKSMRCKFCPYIAPQLSLLQSHYLTHHEERYPGDDMTTETAPDAVNACRFCDDIVSDKELLPHELRHVEEYLGLNKPDANIAADNECFVCHTRIASGQLRKHIQEHGNRKLSARSKANLEPKLISANISTKRFECNYEGCNRSYQNRGDLNVHLKTHSDTKKFKCDQCDKAFPTKKQLKAHSLVHQVLMTFNCQYCDYRAKTKVHLNRHIRIHAGSKPYTCMYCEYSSTTLGNLRKHILLSKKHKGLPMYECSKDNCSFVSDTLRNVQDHMLNTHGVNQSKLMVKSTENDWTDVMEGHPILPVQH